MFDKDSRARMIIEQAIQSASGILRLEPAWVARDFLPPGKRLGLQEEQYDLGERGAICERWLASTTLAANRVKVPDEGLSFLALESKERVTLKEAIDVAGDQIMGKEYASTHSGLGRLAKIFDYADRIPYHFHQMKQHASLVGQNPKEEAYYFPDGVPMGPHPEAFLGVHPYISERKQYDVLLPYLVDWNSDLILRHSKAYLLSPNDGFHVPAGTLHAPGTALTIELQEDSDVFAMLQARVGDRMMSKELLFKDVRKEDREKYGERIILEMINWEVSGDPYFYENRHTPPLAVEHSMQESGEEQWIFYNTTRFSGKKLVVRSKARFESVDKGVYSLLVWSGKGKCGRHEIEGGNPQMDELLITHDAAVRGVRVENTGEDDLVIFKFFGPDINDDVPVLSHLGRQ